MNNKEIKLNTFIALLAKFPVDTTKLFDQTNNELERKLIEYGIKKNVCGNNN
ncbi:MAG: hypothetical protein RBS24_00045 [Bacilli bacterium]|nr:hypothetical protein [Bacilli bacterium]